MICVYDGASKNWSNNGLTILFPTSCTVRQVAGGEYELQMVHPMSFDGRWSYLIENNIIKAPVPLVSAPSVKVSQQTGNTAVSEWQAIVHQSTNAAGYVQTAYFEVRTQPGGGRIVDNVYGGQKCFHDGQVSSDGLHIHITTLRNITGWVYLGKEKNYIIKVKEYTKSQEAELEEVLPKVQATAQCFRIYSVSCDTSKREVTVNARHISYDFADAILGNCKLEKSTLQNALTVIRQASLIKDASMNLVTNMNDAWRVTADYSWKNGMFALLDPDEGILQRRRAKLVRNDKTIYLLANSTKDRGFKVSYGKNLVGVTWSKNAEDVVTRIVPLGQQEDGTTLVLPEKYVDSSHINDYPRVRMQTLDVSDAKASKSMTLEQCYTVMRSEAKKEFDNGRDLADLEIEVDFINLGDTMEYKQYKNLQQVFLYDTITIEHAPFGFKAKAQVKEYEWDAIYCRYTKMTVGNVFEVRGAGISGYQLPNGGITGSKIAPMSIDTSNVADGAILGAKIAQATITSANIADGAIETAHIGNAQIVNAHIQDATIDKGKIKDFSAQVASITKAEIGNAVIHSAQIDDLQAATATLVAAQVGNAVIHSAQIDDLQATVADITTATIDNAEISSAQIKDLQAATASIINAQIDWADIDTLNAHIVDATKAEIENAEIDFAQIKNLDANIARVQNGIISNATIDAANVNNLDAGVAEITRAEIGNARISYAQIDGLTAGNALITQGTSGKLYVADLAVTEANMVNLTVGELVVKGDDGCFYSVSVDKNGAVTTQKKQIGNDDVVNTSINGGEKLVQGSVTAACLNAKSIFADNALIRQLIAQNLDVDTLVANAAKIGKITTSVIASDDFKALNLQSSAQVDVTVSNALKPVQDKVNNAESRLTVVEDGISAVSTIEDTVNRHEGTLSILSDEIEQRVSNTEFRQTVDGLVSEDRLAQVKETIVKQTDESIEIQIKDMTAKVDAESDRIDNIENNLSTNFTFDDDGLGICKSGSEFSAKFGNAELTFFQSGRQIATFGNYELSVPEAVVHNAITIGKLKANINSDGDINWMYIGGDE